MIVVSLLLILVAVTLLAVGLAVGSSPLLISSIVASLLAAVALVVGARQAATQRRKPVVTERPTRLAPAPPIRRGATATAAAPAAFTDEADARSGNAHSDFSGSDPISVDNDHSPHAGPDVASARHSPGVEPESAEPDADLQDGRPASGAASAAHPGANGPAADRVADDDSGDRASVGATEPLAEEDARAAGRHDAEAALAGDPAVEHVQSTGASPEISGAGDPDEDDPADEPPPQAVRPGDAVSVARMDAEVLVVDGRPRYHLADCPHLVGRRTEPLPANEAVELGFSPCGRCRPVDRLVAEAAHR